LHEGIGHDQGDAYLALRIQKNKNSEEFSIIFDKTNNFSQEIKVLSPSNAISSDLEAADSVVHARSRVIRCPSKTKDLEWEVGTSPGGCPFGFKKKMNMNIFEWLSTSYSQLVSTGPAKCVFSSHGSHGRG